MGQKMKIITSISKKGGSGKTTTLLGLAMVAARNGLKTVLLDTDSNQPMNTFAASATDQDRWADNIDAISIFDHPEQISDIFDTLESKGVEVVIVDTQGGEGAFLLPLMQLSDFIIIPSALSSLDLDGAENTLIWLDDLKQQGVELAKFRVLISQLPTKSNRSQAENIILEDLQENFPLLETTIPISKLSKNQSTYGLFHKAVEYLKQSGDQRQIMQARSFENVLNTYQCLFDEIDGIIGG